MSLIRTNLHYLCNFPNKYFQYPKEAFTHLFIYRRDFDSFQINICNLFANKKPVSMFVKKFAKDKTGSKISKTVSLILE